MWHQSDIIKHHNYMERWPEKVKQKSDFERTRKGKLKRTIEMLTTVWINWDSFGQNWTWIHGNIFQHLWWAPGIIDGNASRQSSLGREHSPNVKCNSMMLNNVVKTRSLTLWTECNYHNSVLFSHKWASDRIEFRAKLCKCGAHSGTSLLLLEQFNTSKRKDQTCNDLNGRSFT